MGWVYIGNEPHSCQRPDGRKGVPAGSIWECPVCTEQWEYYATYSLFRTTHNWIKVPHELRVQTNRKDQR